VLSLKAVEDGHFVKVRVSKSGFESITSDPPARFKVTTAGDIVISAEALSNLDTINGVAVALPVSGRIVTLSATVVGSGTFTTQREKERRRDSERKRHRSGSQRRNCPVPVPVTNDAGGLYDLVVRNGANIAYSKPLTLIVDPKLESLEGPTDVNPGDGVRFRVNVTSKQTLVYQWYENGNALSDDGNISGAQSETLTLKKAATSDTGVYSVEARHSNNALVKVSAQRSLNVAGVTIVSVSPDQTLNEGTSAQLSVSATGVGSLSYQWTKNGVAVNGGSYATLPLTAGAPDSVTGVYAVEGLYQVSVSNGSATASSRLIRVSVVPGLKVTIDPAGDGDRRSACRLDHRSTRLQMRPEQEPSRTSGSKDRTRKHPETVVDQSGIGFG